MWEGNELFVRQTQNMSPDIVAFANSENGSQSDLAQYNLGYEIDENYIVLSTFQVQHWNSSENEQSDIIIFVPQLTSVLRRV